MPDQPASADRIITDNPANKSELSHGADKAKAVIKVSDLEKSFSRDGKPIQAVENLSFEVLPGQVFGLLGPNGAGKTTTLRMILGLIPPDKGYATILGIRSDKEPEEVKRQIGFVSANTGLYQWLTARETLLFFAAAYGVSTQQAEESLNSLADQLEMTSFLDQRCSSLSTGQQQRVNLARGMIHRPPVMLLDEPTLGLDVIGSQVVFEYLEILKRNQCAVILSTHRLEQAQRVCDVFGLMGNGKLRACGSWGQIQKETKAESLVDLFVMWNKAGKEKRGPKKV